MKAHLALTIAAVAALAASAGGTSLDGFKSPPRANRPETWMQVSGGNASKEGMTLDLEAILVGLRQ